MLLTVHKNAWCCTHGRLKSHKLCIEITSLYHPSLSIKKEKESSNYPTYVFRACHRYQTYFYVAQCKHKCLQYIILMCLSKHRFHCSHAFMVATKGPIRHNHVCILCAFDRVWHDGLFYKLLTTSGTNGHDPAIDANTPLVFHDMYRNASRIRYIRMTRYPIYKRTSRTGQFPSRRRLKSIVERSVERRAKEDISRRLQASDQWGITVTVVERDECSPIWRVARDNPQLLFMC